MQMKKEVLYLAGPLCFYPGGYALWNAMRGQAQALGFQVSMPSEGDLPMDPADLQKNARTIFENCARSMNASTALLCNLEFFRGPEPDGGSVFELGMAYARGLRCYGYTRDKRPMVWKYQGGTLKDGQVYDRKGRPLPYGNLPFSPNILGAAKIIEGSYEDCLRFFRADAENDVCRPAAPAAPALPRQGQPVVYLAGPQRWEKDARERYARMKALCAQHGLSALTPLDELPGATPVLSEDPYENARHTFYRQQQQVRRCDAVIADLNDFHGWEPDSDTAFECGMGYQLGKKLFGYMDSTVSMIHRIPNRGSAQEYRDACGCTVENFDFPINLMFSASMPLYEGNFEAVIGPVAAALKNA